jgi:hypothetical protein
LKSDTVWREVFGGFEGAAVLVIEPSFAGTKDYSSNEGRASTGHVDNTRSSKIDDTNTPERIIAESGQETVGAPDRPDNNWVDQSSKEDRVADVSRHLASLGHGTGDNGSTGGGKSKLEEESNVIGSTGKVKKEKVAPSDQTDIS